MKSEFFTTYLHIRKTYNLTLVNETKFIQVVEFWFQYFDYINDFIVHEGKDINLLKSALISKSILYSFDVLDEKNSIDILPKNKLKQKIFGMVNLGKKGFLPAGVSSRITDKIRFKLLLNKTKGIQTIVNHDFKNKFFEKCSEHFDIKTVEVMKYILPDVFFSVGLSSSGHLPYVLKGSPLCFFDFHYNYLKLLIQSRKVEIIGVQHGGVYGEWKDNPFEKFEKNISDFYYGWGFFNRNIIQNRFKKNQKKIIVKKGVFWFGRDQSYVPKGVDFGNKIIEHNQVVRHIAFFNTFFKKHDFKFLPHPRLNPVIYKQVIDKSRFVYVKNSAQYVANAKLVVFDCLSHTLMYYCLFNKIPFVIVLDTWPIIGLSYSAIEFYNELFYNGLLLSKEDLDIANKLKLLSKKLKGNETGFFTNDLVNYIDEKFFSHENIELI